MSDVAGKTIYITGGASGMGLAAAKLLAGLGAQIVVFDLDPGQTALDAVRAARREPSQQVTSYKLNVVDREVVLATVERAVAEQGVPDIAINMAGIGGACELANQKFEVFDRIIRVNVYGSRNIVEAVLPSMLARGRGTIVLVGSMGGIIPVYGYTAYGSSKFAVVGLAQCLRYELKPRGIHVACFCPGEVRTPGLAAERTSLPPAAAALKKLGGAMPVESAVRGLVEGIRGDKFIIIPGARTKLMYWLHRLAPDWLWNGVTDTMVARALCQAPGPPAGSSAIVKEGLQTQSDTESK